ncbi:MAG TPA: YgdI/YgdR family lipoprotein [Spongiibacteraceae bacterium]|nr:YgdI/YgdR family lipoprotein [Spongiibacteraceae bacterium]
MQTSLCKIAFIAVFCGVLAACSSTPYLITTKEGAVIEAHGKPKVDEKAGMVTYRDSEGRSMQMRREDISQIIER